MRGDQKVLVTLNSSLAQNPWGLLRRTSRTFQRGFPDSYRYDQEIKLQTFPMRTEIQLEKDPAWSRVLPAGTAGELFLAWEEPPGA